MIQHIRVDGQTNAAIAQAAHDAGLAYDAMLEWIVCDWAQTWRGRQRARLEIIAAFEAAGMEQHAISN
jgi:hypothetical protein